MRCERRRERWESIGGKKVRQSSATDGGSVAAGVEPSEGASTLCVCVGEHLATMTTRAGRPENRAGSGVARKGGYRPALACHQNAEPPLLVCPSGGNTERGSWDREV